MENEKVFRTKTGFCHITPTEIILTRDGVVGNVVKVTVGNTVWRIRAIYLGVIVFLSFSIYEASKQGFSYRMIFPAILVAFMIYGILSSLNISATPVIDRNKISEIKFRKGIQGLTRSSFEVFFSDERGKRMKRLILLPGTLTDGTNETNKALEILKEENLIKQ